MKKVVIAAFCIMVFGVCGLLAEAVFAMQPPFGQQVRYYGPAVSPAVTNDFNTSEPVAFGSAAFGGATFDAQVGLTDLLFTGNVYIAYSTASDPTKINIMNPDNSFTQYDLNTIVAQVLAGMPLPMVQPWRTNTMGNFNMSVIQTATANLPPDVYTVYMLLTPAGTFSSFYLWITYFVVTGF